MRDEVNSLYADAHITCAGRTKAEISLLSQKEIIDILSRIADQKFNPKKDIESGLFNHTFKALNKAVAKVYGNLEFDHPDYDFVQELRYNNAVFAAFKTHRQQNDIHKLLVDEDGALRSFVEFARTAGPVIGDYNVNWLKTEYSTAVMRARVAQQLRQAEGEKHLYPNLQWLPSTAPNPREAHKPFYDMIRRLDDPFWQKHLPGSIWNCQCGLKSTAEPVNNIGPQNENIPIKPMPGLDNNPMDGALFSKSHPYFAERYGGAKNATADFIKMNKEATARYVREDDGSGKGYLYSHTFRGSNSNYAKNKEIGLQLAAQGYKVRLLPDIPPEWKELRRLFIPDGAKEGKNPDAMIGGKVFEFKQLSRNTYNAIDQRLRDAGKQADYALIHIREAMDEKIIFEALKGRMGRQENVNEVWLLRGQVLTKYTRKQILEYFD